MAFLQNIILVIWEKNLKICKKLNEIKILNSSMKVKQIIIMKNNLCCCFICLEYKNKIIKPTNKENIILNYIIFL